MQNFNNKYRSQDVLLIDDVQFFEKAEKTQEALFHIFNDLYDRHKQIILSSDRPVKNLTFLEERLASRFAAGITVDIGFPSLEDRIAILQKKAQNLKMNVSQEVLYYLADAERNNIRILEGMLKTVHLFSKLNKHDADSVAFAKEALRDSVITADDNITVQTVADVCCNYFHIKPEDLTGKRRNKEFVVPRQYAMYIVTLVLPSTPLTAIGEYFNRDHSTVISARDKIGRLYQTDSETKRIVEDIKNLVLNQ
jgi:chromosomal replication initiator protein